MFPNALALTVNFGIYECGEITIFRSINAISAPKAFIKGIFDYFRHCVGLVYSVTDCEGGLNLVRFMLLISWLWGEFPVDRDKA